ncbi:MAG: efflux RND transporter periplasmic adaptor subunit, partial [SAR324 cluster bacterium]
KKSVQYLTFKVDRATVVAKVSATGILNAIVTVQVGSQVSGRIDSLLVDYNSVVKKGQLLATIDPALYKAALEMGKANVLAAEGNLVRARATAKNSALQFKRNTGLAAQNIVAQADLDTSQAQAEADEAQVKASEGALAQARAALQQAQLNLGYTRIISPVDGIVVSRNVDLGQTVAAAFTAPTLFLIAEDLTKMQIDTSIAEADVGRLRAGMAATYTLDGYPGQVFQGKILQVRFNPTTISNVVTYDAVIDVDNKKWLFKPGMTANVTIVTTTATDVLRVANAAIRFQPPGAAATTSAATQGPTAAQPVPNAPGAAAVQTQSPGEQVVWLLKDATPRRVRFRPGISDGTYTEVASGDLHEGDVVITDVLGGAAAANAFRVF